LAAWHRAPRPKALRFQPAHDQAEVTACRRARRIAAPVTEKPRISIIHVPGSGVAVGTGVVEIPAGGCGVSGPGIGG
jgi:hypothetical protein